MSDEELTSLVEAHVQVLGKQDYEFGVSASAIDLGNSEFVRKRNPGRDQQVWPKSSETRNSDGESDDSAASLHKFWHRAGWLVLLLMFQSTSSIILKHFEMLIKTHPVVIYFLTMLVGAGGNAGSQSTVLVVRRLALAAVGGKSSTDGDPRFSVRKIVGSEVSVGAQLAAVLFIASFARCILFQVRGVECVAICLSMLAIVFTSTVVGAALPLLLQKLRIDPAHAGATIQVVMDISGVLLTCVVSCIVLGLPIGGMNSANATAALATTTAPIQTHTVASIAAADSAPGLGIAHEGISSLSSFGGEVAHASHRP